MTRAYQIRIPVLVTVSVPDWPGYEKDTIDEDRAKVIAMGAVRQHSYQAPGSVRDHVVQVMVDRETAVRT